MYISIKVSSKEEREEAIKELTKLGGVHDVNWDDEFLSDGFLDRIIEDKMCFVILSCDSIGTHPHKGLGEPTIYNSLEEFKTLTKH